MIERFLEDIYEGYTFKDFEQFDRGVDEALKKMTPEEKQKVEETFEVDKLREVLKNKYSEEIREEMDLIGKNLTEENEWDYIYYMNLYEFYMVI